MPANLDYKADLQIDQDNLELEWAKQPERAARWAERAIDAENHRDRVKTRLALKWAELDFSIRSNPQAYGFESAPTERAIRSTILSNREYQDLQEEYLVSKHDAAVLKIGAREIKGLEKVIDRSTKLYLSRYYAESGKLPCAESGDSAEIQAQEAFNIHMKTRKLLRPR